MEKIFTFISEGNIFGLLSYIEGVLLLRSGFINGLILSFVIKLAFKALLDLIF
ncbi:MAG: hypothetical protein IJ309_02975 [Clostridia bacterium]|nr:hypothetical protein [Clostridia bacterium]